MSKKYQRVALIGSGSFGKAWLVTKAGCAKKMVSKEIKVTQLTEKETDQCVTEVMVLASCNHGNIIRYIDAYVEERCLYIVMEFADGGDLQRRIFKQNGIYFDKEVILEWFAQIMMALEYIHSRNILHRDLKSQNVFLTRNNIIKLGDFGIAKVLQSQDDHAMTTIGTPFYISPEICQKKPYNSSSDMWAAGCLLFEMCLLRMPFTAPNFTSLVLTILQGSYDPLPRYFGPVLQQLVSSLLLIQPSSRLTASQVINLPEISIIVKKLLSKHSDIYSKSGSRSPVSFYRENRCQRSRSRSPGFDKLSKEKHADNMDVKENVENQLSTNVAPLSRRKRQDFLLKERNRRELVKSSQQGRSLTPDLRRVRRGDRQRSESRRHSYSEKDGKENVPFENASVSGTQNNKESRRIEKNDFRARERNRKPCVESKDKTGDMMEGCIEDEAKGVGSDKNSGEKIDNTNNSSKVSKKTYVIKESVLRRLSQASPVLSETVRKQRASLSLDMEPPKSSKVKTPTASLFSCENSHDDVTLAVNQNINVSGQSEDSVNVFNQSEDNVFDQSECNDFETRDKLEVKRADCLSVQGKAGYETGPFDVECQRKRVNSTTYTVKSGSVNNNYNPENNIPDVNEILFLAASVSKQNPKLGRDILQDSIVSHLGQSEGRQLVSMVTRHLDAGQSYQTLVKSLSEKEKLILPIVLNIHNFS